LEIALEKVDTGTFKKLAANILSKRGFDVSPTEGTGADGERVADLRRGNGWRAIFHSNIEDNILSNGYLRSEDLHEKRQIQQG